MAIKEDTPFNTRHCRDCRYCGTVKTVLVCQRYPPQLVPEKSRTEVYEGGSTTQYVHYTLFPSVMPYGSCGEWETRD